VQAAEAGDEFMTGAQVEMVGVAEDDLCAQILKDVLRNGFYCALSAYGHEDRGFHGLVGEMDAGAPGAAGMSAEEFETKGHRLIVFGIGPGSRFARIWPTLAAIKPRQRWGTRFVVYATRARILDSIMLQGTKAGLAVHWMVSDSAAES